MNRDERFFAIAIADPASIEQLADAILEDHAVAVLKPPTGGAVMMRAIETAGGTVFNAGEVAVTEAEVTVDGERGYAMVMGFAPRHALAGAILDAAAELDGEHTGDIDMLLRDALRRQARKEHDEWARVAPTRVAFDEIPQ